MVCFNGYACNTIVYQESENFVLVGLQQYVHAVTQNIAHRNSGNVTKNKDSHRNIGNTMFFV